MAISSPEDLCNEALRAIGFRTVIGDIYEGSQQSRACLEIYSQTRDEILTQDFASDYARSLLALTLLKGPPPFGGYSAVGAWSPIYPAPGFLYEYAYPADMIELGAIMSPATPLPDFDPQPAVWRVDNDPLPIVSGHPPTAAGPPQKVILTNLANAVAVYRRRVTDLTLWEPPGLQAFITRMAAKLAASPTLASSQQLMQNAPQEAVYAENVAAGHRG